MSSVSVAYQKENTSASGIFLPNLAGPIWSLGQNLGRRFFSMQEIILQTLGAVSYWGRLGRRDMFGIPEQPSKSSIVFLKENPLDLKSSISMTEEKAKMETLPLFDFSDSESGDFEMPQDFQRVSKQLDKVVSALSSVQIALAELNVRHEHMANDMTLSETQYKAEILRLRDEVNSLSARIGNLERLIWKAVGAAAVISLALPYLFKFVVGSF